MFFLMSLFFFFSPTGANTRKRRFLNISTYQLPNCFSFVFLLFSFGFPFGLLDFCVLFCISCSVLFFSFSSSRLPYSFFASSLSLFLLCHLACPVASGKESLQGPGFWGGPQKMDGTRIVEVTTGHTNGRRGEGEGENACHHGLGVAILGQRPKPRQSICFFHFSHPPTT